MTSTHAPVARKTLLSLRNYLCRETELLVDAAHDLAIDSRPARTSPLCRTCKPTWRTVLASTVGALVNESIIRKGRTIERIDAALERLDDGTYGICVDCNAQIPSGCLATLPYADRCVPCESQPLSGRRAAT